MSRGATPCPPVEGSPGCQCLGRKELLQCNNLGCLCGTRDETLFVVKESKEITTPTFDGEGRDLL